MAALIQLDTHVVVWLYLPRLDLLSDRAREVLDQDDLAISPMVLLELELLQEIGRLRVGSHEVFGSLRAQLGLRLAEEAFAEVVEAARGPQLDARPLRPAHSRAGGQLRQRAADARPHHPRELRPRRMVSWGT